MRSLIGFALLAFIPVLTACEGLVIVGDPVYTQKYVVEDYQNAALNGEIRTKIVGNPFSGPADVFTGTVTGQMKGANLGRETAFTPTPKGAGSGRYHVVMAFNPAISVAADDLCAGASWPTPGKTGGRVTLLSAFCFDSDLLSTADGRITRAQGTDDPMFRKLVRQVTLALFPAYDRYDIGGDGGSTSD